MKNKKEYFCFYPISLPGQRAARPQRGAADHPGGIGI
jgi:hypothetical protein